MQPTPVFPAPIRPVRRLAWLAAAVLIVAAVVPPAVSAGTALPRVYHDVRTTDKVIAITIDDGYSTDTCLSMAETLRRTAATATFCPIGKNVRAHPRSWRSIAAEFPIANHTMFHPLLTRLSQARIEDEIQRQARAVKAFTGVAAQPYLRPPGGSWNDTVRRAARATGLEALILWDTTDADTAMHSSWAAMLRTAMRGGPGSILLMHCNRSVSATLLPAIIKGYRERGFRFVTVEQLVTRTWKTASGTRAAPLDPAAPGAPDPATGPAAWMMVVALETAPARFPLRERDA
jgi:peptidoglycan/xylan/chitin deacetylase (PgdA/CDA1 family)